MGAWDKQIDRDGNTLADELVDILRELKDTLQKIEDHLSRRESQ